VAGGKKTTMRVTSVMAKAGEGDGAGDRIFSDIFRVAIFWIVSPIDFPQIPFLAVARQTPQWRSCRQTDGSVTWQ
jgi:hypothetical protein